ncbi:ABC transporter ATP-binding protein [Streptomyces sp. YIM 98790]|uniref:ATP-binding cassette domain-containing protein n=1 Tax=Streptomyces sp. YIM 98790 TaxID=2689077 RepID=UPI00140B6698|nr:ABC transporter ATP-binding protein [Streptomyces sp. YIM 98790]
MTDQRPIFERRAVIRAVHALVQPDFPVPPGGRPAVLIEGPPGSGKTVLLDALAGRIRPHIPYGRADFTDPRHEDIPHTLSVLAGALTHRRPRYRRLRFPRLLMGLLVIGQDLTHLDFEQARQDVTGLLRRRRHGSWPHRFLQEVAGQNLELGLATGLLGTSLQMPLRVLDTLLGFTFPGRAQTWFGHRDRDLPDHPVDTLVTLNARAREARSEEGGEERAAAARAFTARLLCEAFLADLRDAPRRVRRLATPVIMLDNAGTPAGRRFLRRLLEARPPLGPAEPLTVIATAHGPLPELSDAPTAPLLSVLEVPGRPPAPAAETTGPLWLRYRLPDLGRADVQTLLDGGSGRGDRRLARLVHEFSGGHAETAGLLAELTVRGGDPPGSVGELLGRPVPREPDAGGTGGPATAEERLLHRLLPPEAHAAEAAVTALACSAAARCETDGLWLSHQDELIDPAWQDTVRQAALWQPDGGAGGTAADGGSPDSRTLVLRRLLLRRLAGPGWHTVHTRLAGFCRAAGDRTGELYYRLAADDLEQVPRELSALLPGTGGPDWLRLLTEVSRAPCGSPERWRLEPYAHFRRLLEMAGPEPGDSAEAWTARAVAALRVLADPAGGTDRGFLCSQTARALAALAPYSRDGLVDLHRAAREYERQAQWWS